MRESTRALARRRAGAHLVAVYSVAMARTARRVLVIGRVHAVNQRVVEQLGERGHAAVGAAGEGSFPELDARGFDLVAIGSGVDPETRASLKQRFSAQAPGVLLLDAYGPLAAEQVEAALRRADGEPAALAELAVEDAGELRQIRVTVARACRLRLAVYRHRGSPAAEVVPVAEVGVTTGAHVFTVAQSLTGEGHVLVVRADDDVEVRRLSG